MVRARVLLPLVSAALLLAVVLVVAPGAAPVPFGRAAAAVVPSTTAPPGASPATASPPGPTGPAGSSGSSGSPVAVTVAAPALSWRSCPSWPGFQCATLTVPLDYDHPDAATVGIAVLRSRAGNSSNRLGSLLVNPGGPGVSARAFARQAARLFPPVLTDRYDIVGFDPRGVGGSEPVRCLTDAEEDAFFAVDPTPDSAAEHGELVAQARLMAAACARRNGTLLPFLSSDVVVRDMEQLRIALGEPTLSYAGFSYGTMLGVLYADRYPDRVGAFLLDGMLDPTASSEERNRAQAIGFERALGKFLDDCGSRRSCAFASGAQPRAAYERILAGIEAKPLKVTTTRSRKTTTRTVGPAEAVTAVVSALYNRELGWPQLEAALAAAQKGNGRPLLAMFDKYVDRDSAGRYANTDDANQAINCVDAPAPRDVASFDDMASRLTKISPNFGAVTSYFSLPCAFWPVPSPPQRSLPVAKGSAPILVVGTVGDPATPYSWAERVAASLDNAVLLTYEGEGHTAYIGGPRCVTRAVEDYLVRTATPADGTRCAKR